MPPMLPLLLLLSVLQFGVHQCMANDTPFVINRALNRVEFSDLLLEYNHNHADERSVEGILSVTISFEIRHIYVYSHVVSLSCEVFQQWRDSRLKYSGATSITIPNDIKIWMPDTSFVNSGTTFGSESSLRLYSDGIVCRKQRVILAVPCIPDFGSTQDNSNHLNCSLIIGSFDNAGTGMITYAVGNVSLPTELDRFSASRILNYTSNTFEEKSLNGEQLHRTALYFIVESDDIAHFFNRTEL